MNPNLEIVNYTDYRKFLRDYYSASKKKIPHFSYRLLSERAGFASPSFLRLVIEGKKNLTPASALQVAKALRLTARSAAYFKKIVLFNQSRLFSDKEKLLKQIDRYRKRNNPELLPPHEYDYLKEWLHAVVREVVLVKDFVENPQVIAGKFTVRVQPEEVKKSLAFLIEHGYLERDAGNRLVPSKKTISTFDIPQSEELVFIAKRYHLQMLDCAKQALLELPKNVRSITNTTLALSRATFEQAVKRIESLRFELLELAAADQACDRVCQLSVNLFPLVLENHD
jgi:uncharacterized protein (TIGR02147 family)